MDVSETVVKGLWLLCFRGVGMGPGDLCDVPNWDFFWLHSGRYLR